MVSVSRAVPVTVISTWKTLVTRVRVRRPKRLRLSAVVGAFRYLWISCTVNMFVTGGGYRDWMSAGLVRTLSARVTNAERDSSAIVPRKIYGPHNRWYTCTTNARPGIVILCVGIVIVIAIATVTVIIITSIITGAISRLPK